MTEGSRDNESLLARAQALLDRENERVLARRRRAQALLERALKRAKTLRSGVTPGSLTEAVGAAVSIAEDLVEVAALAVELLAEADPAPRHDPTGEAAKKAHAQQRWVSPDGYTQLPDAMREELGLEGGGHVWFLKGPHKWEAWPEKEIDEQLGLGSEGE